MVGTKVQNRSLVATGDESFILKMVLRLLFYQMNWIAVWRVKYYQIISYRTNVEPHSSFDHKPYFSNVHTRLGVVISH